MKLDITDAHFIELHKKGYSVDVILMLSWLQKDLSVIHIREGSKKIDALYKTMERKNLISSSGKLTEIGIDLLDFVSKKTNKTLIKPKALQDADFMKWWALFPSNDKFVIKGKSFGPTRAFKVKKDDCHLLFNKMIIGKEFTAEEIITATAYDIALKKNLSYTKNENQLKFLQNSHTYLYQKSFDGFIGMDINEIEGVKPGGRRTNNSSSIDV